MKPAPTPVITPFFARPNPKAHLVVRSGLQAGEYKTKASEDIHKLG